MTVSFPPMITQSLFDSRPPLSFKTESSLSLSVTPSSLSTPSLSVVQSILRNYKVSGGRGTVDEEVNISTTLWGGWSQILSLWVVLLLTWGIHTYLIFFAYIVNIIWESLEIILWETIHSSRREVINWSLREAPWRHYESNRAIELYSILTRTQTKPQCDLNPASIPTIPTVTCNHPWVSILQKNRSTNSSMSELPTPT
jgi:hypothetical protein